MAVRKSVAKITPADTPEQIAACLQCERDVCTNCIFTEKAYASKAKWVAKQKMAKNK